MPPLVLQPSHAALKRVAHRSGVLDPARRVRLALADERERRKRRDHEAMPVLLAAVVNRDAWCVDVGAHRGSVLETLVRLAPEGQHVAFEPLPAFADALAKRFPEVDVRHAAVSSDMGTVPFQYFPDHADCSGIEPLVVLSEPEEIRVPMVTLDNELAARERVSLLKIDVEGAELDVLRGAERVLAEHRPVVLFEHTVAAVCHGVWSAELHDILTCAGLRVFSLDGEGPLSPRSFSELVTQHAHENFIARS